MKTFIGSQRRILTGFAILFSILSISNSCSKSAMDNMYGGGNNGGGGNKGNPGLNEVWMQGMLFTPSSITIKEGTTITWTNKDAVDHIVTSDDGLFNSGTLGSGKTYSYKFSAAGTYLYHCSIHPMMTAKIIVTSVTVSSASVSIVGMTFSPASITVPAGTKVTWTNNSTMAHTVTSGSGLFDSGGLSAAGLYNSGGTFSYTFLTAGTYLYHCAYHSSMTAKVIVN